MPHSVSSKATDQTLCLMTPWSINWSSSDGEERRARESEGERPINEPGLARVCLEALDGVQMGNLRRMRPEMLVPLRWNSSLGLRQIAWTESMLGPDR